MFWQSLPLARSRLCFCELAVYREAIFLPEFESLSCSELNIYIYIYIYIYIFGCLPFSNRTEHGRRELPTSSLVEIQGLFASLKQDLRQEIEAKFRVLDGPESNEDESSNGDEESTEVSPALTSCLADYLGDAPKSSFDNLAEEFSTADKTSAPVNAKLATMIEELIKGNLPKAKLEHLVEKYPRPENCKAIDIPLQQGDKPLNCNLQVGYKSSNDSIIRSGAPFKAGQLRNCLKEWQRITSDPFILQCVSNCELEFNYLPTPNCIPNSLHPESKFSLTEQEAIDAEINDFLVKQVIEQSQPETGEIFSPIFLRPKKEPRVYRVIFNLKSLN